MNLPCSAVYPNPTNSDLVFLETGDDTDLSDYSLFLVDTNGKYIPIQYSIASKRLAVDMTGVVNGVYVIMIKDEAGKVVFSQKLIRM
ncbi:MAG: T9SS type A sorting domain-containing protein [Saprospiraceae bacterium]|nr:T9SS type A sorting domain-containing protein [Saprospiraceae bacterium]MCB9326571.1 T9SS type A sorting domain-containing protein [Lewinellaceae bacterium]